MPEDVCPTSQPQAIPLEPCSTPGPSETHPDDAEHPLAQAEPWPQIDCEQPDVPLQLCGYRQIKLHRALAPKLNALGLSETFWPDVTQAFAQLPQALWHVFGQNGIFEHYLWPNLESSNRFEGSLDVYFVDNAAILALNAEHREKPEATDVLSFPMFEPGELDQSPVKTLSSKAAPVALGTVIISVEWGLALLNHELCNTRVTPKPYSSAQSVLLTRYTLQRLIHGALHVFGCHHDSETGYNKVIGLQNQVLHQLAL